MRVALAAIVAGLALGAVGCGGGDDGAATGDGAASLAPKSAALYVSINTDLDSSQVNQFEELLAKFPDRDRLIDEIEQGLASEDVDWERDIKPALGKTFDLVVLDFDDANPVGILKPADKGKLEALLKKGDEPTVSREIEGWTVVADDEAALDRFDQARADGTLDGDARFKDAMEGLPGEALVKLYVNGEAVTEAAEKAGAAGAAGNRLTAFAAALGAESSGLRLDGALDAELTDDLASIEPYESKLLEAAPEDALAFLSANGFGKVTKSLEDAPGVFQQLRELLGLDVKDLAGLLDGEFAFWVGQGAPIPEVTFLAEAENEQQALSALDRLVRLLAESGDAQTRTTEIDGVEARQIIAEGLTITYAAFDGRIIVTTRPGAIADARDEGDSLADSTNFKQAREDAKMEDATFGFLYLDLERLGALVEGFVGASGEEVPPEVARNLEPLGSLLFHASGKPEDLKLSAFLAIE